MLGQVVLAAVLVAFVSSQTTSSNQGGFLLDGSQSSWSTSPDDHVSLEFANRMNRDGSSSLFENQDTSSGLFQDMNTRFPSLDRGMADGNRFDMQGSDSLLNRDGSSSLFENQDTMADFGTSGGLFQDMNTRFPSLDRGMADGNRFDMQGSDSLLNPTRDLLDRSSSLGTQFLRGSTSDGTSSVLDGSLLGDDLSGFGGRRNPWEMSQGARSMGRFPFSSDNLQSMLSGNRGMGMRRGIPWRNLNSDSETGLTSQLGMGRGLLGRSLRLGRGQLGMSNGQMNLLQDLEGDRSRNDLWRTGVESGSQLGSRLGNDELMMSGRRLGNAMRYNPFGRMASMGLGRRSPFGDLSSLSSTNLGQLSPLRRSSSQGWRTTNIGGPSRLGARMGRPSLMSNLDSTSLSSSLGRTLPLGSRSSRMTMYPTGTRSQMNGRGQGQGRRASF